MKTNAKTDYKSLRHIRQQKLDNETHWNQNVNKGANESNRCETCKMVI